MIQFLADILPTRDGVINILLFLILYVAFMYFVVMNEKFRYLAEYFRYKFGKYF